MADTKNKGGRPMKYETLPELQKAVDAYFLDEDMLAERNNWKLPVYTMSGLALYLGIDRQTLLNYSNNEKFFDTIKIAREKVQFMVERRALAGLGTTGAIFNLKNNFGWKDTIHNEVSTPEGSSIKIDNQMSPEEAAQAYLEALNKDK